jgi:two-component system, cell cycle response regulator DivK
MTGGHKAGRSGRRQRLLAVFGKEAAELLAAAEAECTRSRAGKLPQSHNVSELGHRLGGGALVVGMEELAELAGQLELEEDAAKALLLVTRMKRLLDAQPVTPEHTASPRKRAGTFREPMTVVCVDDSEAMLAVIEDIVFLRRGIELVCARTGQSGIEFALTHDPDLILVDLRLPDIDGVEVVRTLRADRRTFGIPVVGLSADPDGGEALIAAGAQAFLPKPFFIPDLLALIDDVGRVTDRMGAS